jgi:hypothetical protein
MKLSTKSRLGLWSLLMGGLLMLAVAVSGSVNLPVKSAQTYDCVSSCYANFRYCLVQGKSQSYCQDQYSICTNNCMFGGAVAPSTNQ